MAAHSSKSKALPGKPSVSSHKVTARKGGIPSEFAPIRREIASSAPVAVLMAHSGLHDNPSAITLDSELIRDGPVSHAAECTQGDAPEAYIAHMQPDRVFHEDQASQAGRAKKTMNTNKQARRVTFALPALPPEDSFDNGAQPLLAPVRKPRAITHHRRASSAPLATAHYTKKKFCENDKPSATTHGTVSTPPVAIVFTDRVSFEDNLSAPMQTYFETSHILPSRSTMARPATYPGLDCVSRIATTDARLAKLKKLRKRLSVTAAVSGGVIGFVVGGPIGAALAGGGGYAVTKAAFKCRERKQQSS